MRRALFALALLTSVACASKDDTTDKPKEQQPPASATLASYTQGEQDFGCLAYVCLFGIAPSESKSFCAADDSRLHDRQAALAAGRLAFDPQKAAACLASLSKVSAQTCWGDGATAFQDDLAASDASCQGVLVGKVAAGGACVESDECADGWCDQSAQQCPGSCANRGAVGSACTSSDACQAGLSCAEKKCVAPAQKGSACSSAQPCADGLLCFDGRCDSPKPEGDPCDPDSGGCATGLYCRPDQSSSTGGLCARTVAKGAECKVGADILGIQSPACEGAQVCVGFQADADGKLLHAGHCQPPSDVGGPCEPVAADADPSNTGCFLGLSCDAATKTCQALPGPGGACPTGGCNQASYCEAATKTCKALKADGEPCQVSGECQHVCRSATNTCGPGILVCHAP